MEHIALRRVYVRTCAIAIYAALLCIGGGIYSNQWSMCIVGLIPIVWGAVSIFTLKKSLRNGEIISVYAVCAGHTGKKIRLYNGKSGRCTTHKFIAAQLDDGITKMEDHFVNETHCFFLSATEEKFKEGETYCFLFRQKADNSLGDANLLTYITVPPDICYFNAAENEVDMVKDTDVDIADEADRMQEKIIVFPSKNEDGRW